MPSEFFALAKHASFRSDVENCIRGTRPSCRGVVAEAEGIQMGAARTAIEMGGLRGSVPVVSFRIENGDTPEIKQHPVRVL